MAAKVLVIGGAGYIGAVCAEVLRRAGHHVTIFDDLSTGHRAACHDDLIVGDIRDRAALGEALRRGGFDGVMHFAAKSLVGESVSNPLTYFDNNTAGTLSMLQCMADAGVRVLVFSSTCAIYGQPERLPLDETHPRAPITPYGVSKEMVEQILDQCRDREGFGITSLRYFNAAGAMPDGNLGESHDPETHLIPLCIHAVLGERPPLKLFGTDYPTRDGTCVRDYIHVFDLAQAHLLALERLFQGESGSGYNLGTGAGTTVREVMESVGRAMDAPVPYEAAPRREGDPTELYADNERIVRELGWDPRHPDLDTITRTAVAWARNPRY